MGARCRSSRLTASSVIVGAVLLLGACGEGSTEPPRPETDRAAGIETSAPETTISGTTASASQDWGGPRVLVTATASELVALDLRSGERVVLADGAELATSLGLEQGRFDDADLSTDGATVAFTYGGFDGDRPSFGLYEVAVDASAPPTRVPLDAGDAEVTRPRYSPDGRLLAVHSLDRLIVLDERRTAADAGVPTASPAQLTWNAAGDELVWLDQYGRSSCCTRASVAVDASTGRVTAGPVRTPTDGSPYVAADGSIATLPTYYTTFDVDASGRFVVASDGSSRRLSWWDLQAAEPTPRSLGLDLDLQESPPVAW